MRKDLIYSPNLFLGHTKIDKTAANYHQFQKKKCDWLCHNFGLCHFQSKKKLSTVGNFLECHGIFFVFIFELSILVIFLKPLHPHTDHHRIHI